MKDRGEANLVQEGKARCRDVQARLQDLCASVETVLANHKGPAIERLRQSYEALPGVKK